MNLLVTAALLAAFSIALVGPLSAGLSRAPWVQRAPRAAVLLWQCVGVGALVSGFGAGLAVAVSRYRSSYMGGSHELIDGLFSGHPLQGIGLSNALGLTLAADLLIVLCVLFGVVTMRTVRLRSRHRKLLDLITYEASEYPGTEFLTDPRAVAYCVPGLRPRIVLSDGTRRLLNHDGVWAVIEHERGHAREHHGLVMFPMLGLGKVLGWMPYARHAPRNIALLLEMAADDYSSRRTGRHTLAAALVEMSTAGSGPCCGMALTGSGIVTRVSRMMSKNPTSWRAAALAFGLGVGALTLPLCVAFLG